MDEPLPYYVLIVGLVFVLLSFMATLYFSYKKSRKFRDIVKFIKSPYESGVYDYSLRSVLKTVLWFIFIHISFTVIYHFIDIIIFNELIPDNSIGSAEKYMPLWTILLLPPLIEETAFRLPLVRNRTNITLSVTLMTFLVSSIFFSARVYEVTWPRMTVCAIMAALMWFYGYKLALKIDFKAWFWFLTAFFSILHIVNYDLGTMAAGVWVRVIAIEAVKIPGALIFAYARIRHGFAMSVILHYIVNLSDFLLGTLV